MMILQEKPENPRSIRNIPQVMIRRMTRSKNTQSVMKNDIKKNVPQKRKIITETVKKDESSSEDEILKDADSSNDDDEKSEDSDDVVDINLLKRKNPNK